MIEAINLDARLALIADHWHPRTVAHVNDFAVKLVKVQGEFVWHTHEEEDEMFFVVHGELTIHLRDGDVVLRPGEMFVVPKGVEHKPSAAEETSLVLLEKLTADQTGGVETELRAADQDWI